MITSGRCDVKPPYAFIDSHAHIPLVIERGVDMARILSDCCSAGVEWVVDVGLSPSGLAARLSALPSHWPLSVGWYPSSARDYTSTAAVSTAVDELRSAVAACAVDRTNTGRICAIGEIGIDLFHDYAPQDAQQELFERQIGAANALGLPIIMHNRSADAAVLASLRRVPPQRGGIAHCFAGDWSLAQALLDCGLSISFAGNLSYKKNGDLRAVAGQVPSDRLLFETDSPFLAPEPHRGETNSPHRVVLVYACYCACTGKKIGDVAEQCVANAAALGLIPPAAVQR